MMDHSNGEKQMDSLKTTEITAKQKLPTTQHFYKLALKTSAAIKNKNASVDTNAKSERASG